MHNEPLTLATICGGAVQEKVNRALEKIANNILDPNTDPGKKRSITLKMVFKPDENDNEDVEVSTEVTVALAPETGVSTRFFVNKDLEDGKVTVMEHRKGEIRGQLDFSDLGYMNKQTLKMREETSPDKSEFDQEPGEITEPVRPDIVMDFRKKAL